VGFPDAWSGADLLFLDCDSTLSTLEGIDELALRRGVDVADLTNRAMSGEVPLDQVYRARLEAISPTRDDLQWLAGRYAYTRVDGARSIVRACLGLGIEVRVLSGGLLPGVAPFAESLGIDAEHCHAVPLAFDEQGNACDLEATCKHPLARAGGKPELIRSIAQQRQVSLDRCMLVGDGASDLEAAQDLGLFVGFGGVVDRPLVREAAQIFLDGPGLHAVATIAAGPARYAELADFSPSLARAGRPWRSAPPTHLADDEALHPGADSSRP